MSNSQYRPDIDGLRAVAILLVIGFHAYPKKVHGGFIGVDIFFVISGYLITGIILTGIQQGNFSLSGFYAKRIKRIFPSLLTVLVACLLVGWFTLFADEYALLGKHVGAGMGFMSNVVLFRESGYFDVSSDFKPLLHLWSLGIEEQFYLLWPAALMLVAVQSRRLMIVLLVCLLSLSLLANILSVKTSPVATFYLPITRFWELLAGAALAYLGTTKINLGQSIAIRNLCAAVGLSLIIYSVRKFTPSTLFPGWNALLPISGTVLLIAAGPNAWVNRQILSRPVMVGIGLISYPLYLWHWPLLSFTRIVEGGSPAKWMIATAMLAGFPLAYLTYRFVERPARFGRFRHTTVLLLFLGLVIGTAGFYTYRQDGLAMRPIEAEADAKAKATINLKADLALRSDTIRLHECHFMSDRPFSEYKKHMARCIAMDPNRKNFLVMGDSHAADTWVALSTAYPEYNFLQVTGGGCTPIEDEYIDIRTDQCNDMIRFMKHEFAGLTRLDGVILTARWGDDYKLVKADVDFYRAKGIPVLVIGPTFEFSADVPKLIKRARLSDGLDISKFGIEHTFKRDHDMQEFFQQEKIPYVSKIDTLCVHGECPAWNKNNEILIPDYGHWTVKGAKQFGRIFREKRTLETTLLKSN